jgi:hypothetical protein
MDLTDYDRKILAILTCDSGFTTGDIADRVRPLFGTTKRQHSGAVLTWLRRLERAGLAKRMDAEAPICWAKAKGAEGLNAPSQEPAGSIANPEAEAQDEGPLVRVDLRFRPGCAADGDTLPSLSRRVLAMLDRQFPDHRLVWMSVDVGDGRLDDGVGEAANGGR